MTKAPDRSEWAEAIRKAGIEAQLPDHYRWGSDAMEQFEVGKRRATEAILAMISAFPDEGIERRGSAQSQPGCDDSASRDASVGSEPSAVEALPQFVWSDIEAADMDYHLAVFALNTREQAEAFLAAVTKAVRP